MSLVVRKVVVAVDSADRSARVFAEAVRVATRLRVSIEGVFVEDEDLLRLADHAFARRFGGAATPRAFVREELEREWRALAAEVKATLQHEAARRNVEARFAVARAEARRAITEGLGEGDLVLVGWGGWSPPAARTAPVRVLHDGSESAARALELGAQLAGSAGRLTVLLPPGVVVEALPQDVGSLRAVALPDALAKTLRQAVAEEPGGLLLVPATCALAAAIAARSLAARFSASVLLVG